MGRAGRLAAIKRTDIALIATCSAVLLFSAVTHILTGRPTVRVPYYVVAYYPLALMPFLLWILAITVILAFRRNQSPLKTVWRVLRRDKLWVVRACGIYVFVECVGTSFSVFKNHIPNIATFYADHPLIEIEASILGVDAWQITHAIFGNHGTLFLDRLYMVFFPVSLIMAIWATVSRDRVFQARGFITIAFAWFILGGILALLFSSSGPIFHELHYGHDRFAPLTERLRSYHDATPLNAIYVSEWLIRLPEEGAFGSGISAMPSVHVGIAYILWLFTQSRLGWKHPASWLAAAYAFLMWIASVHLAWHYALDGVVSVVLLSLFWRWTRFLDPEIARPNVAPTLPARAVG